MRHRWHRSLMMVVALGGMVVGAMAAMTQAASTSEAQDTASMARIDQQIAAHPNQSGVYVLEKGEEALLARAWLADHAQQSIDIQYFIWSTDNIGVLAAESILRAAERGVRVRVIVDDLMTDAPDANLLAMAQHPNIEIRIYNPTINVGVPFYKRWWNAASDFHGINQRMHDKTFIVDGKVAITGGRNMAAEYYDYHHEYNFRDRDALVAGVVVSAMQVNFQRFWNSDLSVPVEVLLAPKEQPVNPQTANNARQQIYAELHRYAADANNFAPEIHAVLNKLSAFDRFIENTRWCSVDLLNDQPGKPLASNEKSAIAASLGQLIAESKEQVVIQSPYLVVSDEVRELLSQAIKRHVRVRINTNSMASTDNLQAFGGYRKQRDELLKMGVEIYEYRPDAASHRTLRSTEVVGTVIHEVTPVFGLHAKTMVIDRRAVFIGTFNLDPRSQNLNTEVGVLIRDATVAQSVHEAIEIDMRPINSWNAASDNPDQFATTGKRWKVRFWQSLPIKSLL